MTSQERLTLLDKWNLCHRCEKAHPMKNRKFCPECLEKIAMESARRYDPQKAHEYQARRRELYQEKKKKGICTRCSRKATYGTLCYECKIKSRRRSREYCQEQKWKRRERGLIPEYRKEHNLCCYCGNPVEDAEKHGRACNACAKWRSEIASRSRGTYFSAWNDAFFRTKGFKTKKEETEGDG